MLQLTAAEATSTYPHTSHGYTSKKLQGTSSASLLHVPRQSRSI